jgi:hypothetical protein
VVSELLREHALRLLVALPGSRAKYYEEITSVFNDSGIIC